MAGTFTGTLNGRCLNAGSGIRPGDRDATKCRGYTLDVTSLEEWPMKPIVLLGTFGRPSKLL